MEHPDPLSPRQVEKLSDSSFIDLRSDMQSAHETLINKSYVVISS